MEIINKIILIFWDAIVSTFDITVAYFGIMLLLGLLMYLLARYTRNLYAKTLGNRAEMYITAWIGTPVHEIGHAFFCLIFGHRITKIRLFTPNARDGSLGSVEHAYNRKNLYQRAGSFFIGAGPVIFGSLVILILLYLLIPNGNLIIDQLRLDASTLHREGITLPQYAGQVTGSFFGMLGMLFTAENMQTWQFWIFMYLVMAIAAHMELSPPDIKEMWGGLLVMIILIFAVSLVYAVFIPSARSFLYAAVPVFSYINQLLFMALLFSLINFLITFLIIIVISLIFRRKVVSPFAR